MDAKPPKRFTEIGWENRQVADEVCKGLVAFLRNMNADVINIADEKINDHCYHMGDCQLGDHPRSLPSSGVGVASLIDRVDHQ